MPDTLPFDPTAPKELPKPGPRQKLTRVQIVKLVIRQIDASGIARCGCGCGARLEPECIDEHMVPRETLPAETCDHIDNRALLNKPCAKAKTVEDQAVIAKGRRQRMESGQQKRRRERGSSIKGRSEIKSRNDLAGRKGKTKWPTRKVGQ